MEQFPTLSGPQIIDRIFATANKTGIYANRDLYGQGLLDLGAASSPVGGLSVPTGSSIYGQTAQMAISVPGVDAGALREKLEDVPILAVDGFQRAPFQVSAGSLVVDADKGKPTLDRRLAQQATTMDAGAVGFAQGTGEALFRANLAGGQVAVASNLSLTELEMAVSPMGTTPVAVRQHLAGATEAVRSMGFGFSQSIGQGWKGGAVAFSGIADGATKNGAGVMLGKEWAGLQLSASLTHTLANGELGGFATGGSSNLVSNTTAAALRMGWQASAQWSVFGGVELATRSAASAQSSTMQYSQESTSSGILAGATFAPTNTMSLSGFYKFEPATRAKVSMTTPNWVSPDGTVTTNKVEFDVSGKARHIGGLHLASKLGADSALGVSASHDTEAGSEVMATWNRRF